ncbi:leucyl-tRNA synthetase [Cutibacterium acnes JCM 18920]|nr:leucyl-tRNA synthetase [Cutibacterium acnes JCM 18920]
MVVQVTGKVRAKLTVSPDITEAEAREVALADVNVQRFTEGKEIVKIIAKLPKMISIVAK